jgi:tetratricopeptide (TPR) repeat protein
MGCLSETQILELVNGATPEGAERHLDECSHCREVVAAAARAFTDVGPASQRTEPSQEPADGVRGASIGRYLLLQVVGRGGMGVVYAAYDPELDRRIALKLLTASDAGGPISRSRLVREAKALARVSHPNVVTVHDAGTIGDEVFIAMEFIEGATVGRWLREKPRSWREVCGVFLQAGRGLAAAHEAGLVHRDFKPENVLIRSDGRVLVTDFGLARPPSGPTQSSAPPEAAAVEITQPGAVAGTPAYMAPEQMRGAPVDARSDEFSFCVALHEALYGERPRPGEPAPDSGDRFLSPRADLLRTRRVPRHIRHAVARGLRSDPRERFPSMSELLAVLGRDPRRRWIRAAVALSVLGLVATAWLAYERGAEQRASMCKPVARELAGIWDKHRRQEVRRALLATRRPYAPDAWKSVRASLDAYAAAWVEARRDACEATWIRGEQSAEALDLRMECLRRRRSELKAVAEVLSRADERVVKRSVETAAGLTALGGCANVELLRAPMRPPIDAIARARVEEAQAELARAKALSRAGRYAEAGVIARRAVETGRALRYRPLEAESLLELGQAEYGHNDYRKAVESLRSARVAAEASRHDRVAARAAVDLVFVLGSRLREHDRAHEWAQLAGASIERLGGDDELSFLLANNVGGVLSLEARMKEARAAFERALSLAEKLGWTEDPRIAALLNNLGVTSRRLGEYEKARSYFERALRIRERAFGREHPRVAFVVNNLGGVFYSLGRFDEAQRLHKRALAISERAVGPDSTDAAMPIENIGIIAENRRQFEVALKYYRRALSIYEKAYGPEHPDGAQILTRIGGILAQMGRDKEALEMHRRALFVREKSLGPSHPDLATSLAGIGEILLDRRQGAEALPLVERALRLRRAATNEPIELGDLRFLVARALRLTGKDPARAKRLAEEARADYRRIGDVRKKELAAVQAWLAARPGK